MTGTERPTTERTRTERPGSTTTLALAALVVVAALGVVALLVLPSGSDDGDDLSSRAETGSSTATTAGASPGSDAPADGADDDAEGSDDGADADADSGSTTTTSVVDDTVEADESPSPDETTEPVDPGDDPDETAPTTPAPTTGTCRITMAELVGQAGTIEVGSGGTCDVVGATIQPVNPRDDLSDVDWGRDIRVCQRHPAATEIGVAIASGGDTVELDGGLSRSDEEAEADPLVAIELTFANQDTPETGPRPILVCRTAGAELSVVHRPPA